MIFPHIFLPENHSLYGFNFNNIEKIQCHFCSSQFLSTRNKDSKKLVLNALSIIKYKNKKYV